MKPKIYGIKNCDTMKKAFAWLDAHKVAYEFHDYKKDGVPPGKLKAWAAKAGWEKLANTRGPTWRKISSGENLSTCGIVERIQAIMPGRCSRGAAVASTRTNSRNF